MYVNRHNNTTVGPQQYNRFTVDGHKLYPDIMWPFIALINGTIRAWPHLDRPWLDLQSLRINAERACKGAAEWPRCGVADDLVVEERVDCLEMAATRAAIDGAPGRD